MKKKYILMLLVIIPAFHAISQNCNYFGNGNFETPVITGTPAYYTSAQMSGWQTTSPDGQMELWQSGYNGVASFSGGQHMEINGYYDSTVFQNIVVSPWTNLAISFAHRGRGATDTLSVSAGPVGGPYTTLGFFGDDEFTWGYYTVNYIVPNMGTNYSIRFNPVYAGVGIQGVGNFLDSVTVCATNVGIDEGTANGNSVSVSPNPFNEKLNITCRENNPTEIILYDITSRKLFEQSFINSISLNTAEFSKGIYYYEVRDRRGLIKKGRIVK